jgi:hypothetical protein
MQPKSNICFSVRDGPGENYSAIYEVAKGTLERCFCALREIELFSTGNYVVDQGDPLVPSGGYDWRKIDVPSNGIVGWMANEYLEPC